MSSAEKQGGETRLFSFKKKKKPKTPTGRIRSMLVNGTDARCLNMRIFYDSDGVGRLEIYTKEPTPALHYDRSEFQVNTLDNKRLVMTAAFESAEKEGNLYHYLFVIEQYNEYFA